MNPSHGLSWEKSGEQEGVFATLFILTGKLQFKKMTCFQTTTTFGPNGDVNISSGRSDWNYFIPIVVVNAASTNMIQASPNGNSIYLYCAMLAEKTIEVNVVCFGK